MEYVFSGAVVHGKAVGRAVGMPTANLCPDAECAHLPEGVYASVAEIDGARYIGVTNVGPRPTVDGDPGITIETHLLDFAGDLYGRRMRLTLKAFLRPTRKMASLEALRAQVEADGLRARALLQDEIAAYRGKIAYEKSASVSASDCAGKGEGV